MSVHQVLQQVVEDALNEGIGAWLRAPTCFFYESDVQALIYGLLRENAIKLGVWESRGKLFPDWKPTLTAIVGTNARVSGRKHPDIVVYEPLGEEVREDQPLSDRKLFCAIELKLAFWSPALHPVNFEPMFRDDLEKLDSLVGEGKARYGISLNFFGWPPFEELPKDKHSYLKNEGREQRVKVICVLAGDKNPITPSSPLW